MSRKKIECPSCGSTWNYAVQGSQQRCRKCGRVWRKGVEEKLVIAEKPVVAEEPAVVEPGWIPRKGR